MTRPYFHALVLLAGCLACFASEASILAENTAPKKAHPSNPEQGGLRLEVDAKLDDALEFGGKTSAWTAAFLDVEVALHNVSPAPITVPTSAYDGEGKPHMVDWPGWGKGMERIVFSIESPTFQGKPTAFVAARFHPVVLAPGEYVLLLRHNLVIQDRKHADAIKEVSVHFGVSSTFAGPSDWWKGQLETVAAIQRYRDPDKEIEHQKAANERYRLQKTAERDPAYGKNNAARIAALIADCDQVDIRRELPKGADALVVHDAGWIQNASKVIAGGALPVSGACFCLGWRTAYFSKGARFVVSVAPIHGHQLRVYWPGGGGDYRVDEAYWNAVKQALEYPAGSGQSSGPTPQDAAPETSDKNPK